MARYPFLQPGHVRIQTKRGDNKRVTRTFENSVAARAYVIRWVGRHLPQYDPGDIANRVHAVGTCYLADGWIKWIEKLPWGLTAAYTTSGPRRRQQ